MSYQDSWERHKILRIIHLARLAVYFLDGKRVRHDVESGDVRGCQVDITVLAQERLGANYLR